MYCGTIFIIVLTLLLVLSQNICIMCSVGVAKLRPCRFTGQSWNDFCVWSSKKENKDFLHNKSQLSTRSFGPEHYTCSQAITQQPFRIDEMQCTHVCLILSKPRVYVCFFRFSHEEPSFLSET